MRKISAIELRKYKSLTWEYFVKQKVIEILSTVGIILGFLFIPFLLGHFVGDNRDIHCDGGIQVPHPVEVECSEFEQWSEGLMYLGILGILFCIIYSWIESNWYKAKRKAAKELKIERLVR